VENNYIRNIIRNVINESFLEEGVYDKNIFKAFFLGGGPGSGKSFVLSQIFGTMSKNGEKIAQSLTGTGLKVFNIDHAFENELRKRKINMKYLSFLTDKEKEQEKIARDVAIKTVNKMWDFYKQGRLGMIVDSTSQNASGVLDFKNELEDLGYDTYMIYVSTDENTALKRNRSRDRVLPDELVKQVWQRANLNKPFLKNIFGDRFYEIDNNLDENGLDKNVPEEIKKTISFLINKPIENPIALKWIEKEKELKKQI
jgi:tRNA uridine 5-carbamoylmethylation protein Kti12